MADKILFLTPGLDPAGGGIQVSAREALEGLSQKHRIEVICYGGIGPSFQSACSSVWECKSTSQFVCTALSRLGQSYQDVLFWHLGMAKALPMIRVRGRRILFLHGIEVWKDPTWLTRRLLDRIDLFLSNSDFTWQRFLEYVPSLRGRRHTTVPLGIGVPCTDEVIVSTDVPRAVMAARMLRSEDYKGHREIIDSWQQVLREVPNAILDIVGEGDLRPELQQIVRDRGFESSIIFHGRVSEQEKERLIRAARCFVMPSRGEGFGLVYLEAMRLGRPCLVSDCDAGQEVIGLDGGVIVNPSDQASIVNALMTLLTDNAQQRKFEVQCRMRYNSAYTAAEFHERLIHALQQ